jgi:AsmA protein
MRLDVALIPLISHQLQVKQVMLKGAVIQLTPQTEAVRDASAPVAPRENTCLMNRLIPAGPLILAN